MIVIPATGDFYQLYRIPSNALDYVRYGMPNEYRYYSTEDAQSTGYWYVHKKYLFDVIELAYKQTGSVDYSCLPHYIQMDIATAKEGWTVTSSRQTSIKSNSSMKLVEAYAQLYLLPNAPQAIVTTVWHSLAKSSHPDQGGDEEVFRRYSDAYARIKKES